MPSPSTVLESHPSVAGALQKLVLVAAQDKFALRSMTKSPVAVPMLENVILSPVAAVPEIRVYTGGIWEAVTLGLAV